MAIVCNGKVGNDIDTQDDKTKLVVDLTNGMHDQGRQDSRGERGTGETRLHAVITASFLIRLYGMYTL